MQTVKYFADVAGSLERVLCLCVEYDLAKMWQSSIVMEAHVMHTALRRETFYGAPLPRLSKACRSCIAARASCCTLILARHTASQKHASAFCMPILAPLLNMRACMVQRARCAATCPCLKH